MRAVEHRVPSPPTHSMCCRAGVTPLKYAIDKKNAEVVAYLRSVGASEQFAPRPGPATVEEISDSPSGGEFCMPLSMSLTCTAHCTLAGGRADDHARQSELL